MTKKVIFVGGTKFSGSTFFHLTLANDPKGFGVGEVRFLFRPMNKRHVRSVWVCGCGDPSCDLWVRVEKRGEKHLYESIFEIHPEIDYIVDSSKDYVWIDTQTNRLAKQNIDTKHIIIWKTLLEYAYSLHKRDRLKNDDGRELADWRSYHQAFYSFMKDFATVRYTEYTQDVQSVLKAACNYLDIPFYEGKERFWERNHHVLGGNLSARLHLYSKKSDGYQDVVNRAQAGKYDIGTVEANYRQIYYEDPSDKTLESYITTLRQRYPQVDRIGAMLTDRDVNNPEGWGREWPDLQLGAIEVHARKARRRAQELSRKYRYENYDN